MEESVLEIEVVDVVVAYDGAAPSAVAYPVPSPYFQPRMTFKVERETTGACGSPRGPTVTIDMDLLAGGFE